MTAIKQTGLIVAPASVHAVIAGEGDTAKAYKVSSWENGKSPKTQDALYAMGRSMGWRIESRFDASHGRRYMLFIYRDADERRACFDHICLPNPFAS